MQCHDLHTSTAVFREAITRPREGFASSSASGPCYAWWPGSPVFIAPHAHFYVFFSHRRLRRMPRRFHRLTGRLGSAEHVRNTLVRPSPGAAST
jgi:hypothetical protein